MTEKNKNENENNKSKVETILSENFEILISFSDLAKLMNYSAQIQRVQHHKPTMDLFLLLIEQIFVEKFDLSIEEVKELFIELRKSSESICKNYKDGTLLKQVTEYVAETKIN